MIVGENVLNTRAHAEISDPAKETARHPNLFTRAPVNGPKITIENAYVNIILADRNTCL